MSKFGMLFQLGPATFCHNFVYVVNLVLNQFTGDVEKHDSLDMKWSVFLSGPLSGCAWANHPFRFDCPNDFEEKIHNVC